MEEEEEDKEVTSFVLKGRRVSCPVSSLSSLLGQLDRRHNCYTCCWIGGLDGGWIGSSHPLPPCPLTSIRTHCLFDLIEPNSPGMNLLSSPYNQSNRSSLDTLLH